MVTKNIFKKVVQNQLSTLGIQINGHQPWDIKVQDERFYQDVLLKGSLGLGESYMNNWIEINELDAFAHKVLLNPLPNTYTNAFKEIWHKFNSILTNKQSKKRADIVGKQHYDLDNDLFKSMLDKRMTYSCGYWKNAKNLDEAQEAKLDLACQKLMIKPGMKILDIGCGWGSFAKYAAEKYGAHVTGITISTRQLELAKELCKGLPVVLRFQDYRDINEKFDRIVSIGQMEHVGYKNYPTYMKIADRSLKDGGIFLLHTIGTNVSACSTDLWIDKYIFPNGMLPSIVQLSTAWEGIFTMEDWHNFGADYDKTLLAWHQNFNNHWDALKDRYSDTFRRMWNYYLLTCAGGFRARSLQLWQIVLSKGGVPGGYVSVR